MRTVDKMSGYNVLLLGLGEQGKATLYDLDNSDMVSDIVVADAAPDLDEYIEEFSSDKVSSVHLDANDEEQISELMNDADIVVEALPPQFAFPMAKLASENGVNMVSSMYLKNPAISDPEKIKAREDALDKIDDMAKDKDITILQEFGFDPGIDLMMVNQAISELDEVQELYCYGAGFPEYEAADNPLKYKFTWSVEGLLHSYLRAGKVLEDGEVREIPEDEMFKPENVHKLKLDELEEPIECFPNGNALDYAETLGLDDEENLKTLGRYTCRWQGHSDFWYPMAKCGFLDEEPIEVEGKKVSPIKFVENLLKPQDMFHLKEDERDVALIRVDARGVKDGEKIRNMYQLIDKKDLETGFTAMQRNVGFTLSIGAQMILKGEIEGPGILTPLDVPLSDVSGMLEKRDINIDHWTVKE